MAGTALVATGLATLASGGAQVYQAKEQKKANKRAMAQEARANQIERARSSVEKSLSRRRALAQARQAAAVNIANANVQGLTQSSSPLQGANASIYSDLGTSIASANRTFVSGQASFDARQQAAFTRSGAEANAALVNAATNAVQSTAMMFKPAG